MRYRGVIIWCFLWVLLIGGSDGYCQVIDTVPARYQVTLKEAHVGDLEIDTRLLDSYELLPENSRRFFFDARYVFSNDSTADFTSSEIIEAAQKYKLALMGGPLLGDLKDGGITLWFRPSTKASILVKVSKSDGGKNIRYRKRSIKPGVAQRIVVDGLSANTNYRYAVYSKRQRIAEGRFTTAPSEEQKGVFKLAFGSCFHKIGLHNPNLVNQILSRDIQAMMLLGDIAVDDRENMINMHRSDYMLRDLSKPWRRLSSNIPLYASWDDHDYLNNDLSGIPEQFSTKDREALLAVWDENWNNPENEVDGIYFNSRIGPVELIMLDTRSCRRIEERGQKGSYLGDEQLEWLKDVLKNSTAPYKLISSGTMWSDYVTKAKDTWGTWDTIAREEIFSFIESENISGVLLISGDRHGARGFTIPRPSGYELYEFEAATLGGVPGPAAMAEDSTNQLFGYKGIDLIAFGEFTFDTSGGNPQVTFRLIDQFGNVLEEHVLPYSCLTPGE